MNTILITNSGKVNAQGLLELNLDAFQGENYLGRLVVNSGAPNHQRLSTIKTEHVQQLEPCPEGKYNLGLLDWAGKEGDYDKLFPSIKSPIWIEIYPKRAIGFHLDGNRSVAPGSAGCMVFKDMIDLKTFVNLWLGFGPFTKCIVDWQLGSITVPAKLKELIKNPHPMKPIK